MSDLIDQELELAEQMGDIPVSKTRRSLENYVRVTKRIDPDPWQRDLCHRLEKAFWLSRAPWLEQDYVEVNIGAGVPYMETPSGCQIPLKEYENNRGQGCHVAIHGPPQHGKSIVISQSYPAWILGFDPAHRFRLATYGINHSKAFSDVTVQLLRSDEHKQFFPDEGSRVPDRLNLIKWSTVARRDLKDGQSSFSSLGLQSGFVGTGFDTLLMDDPYKSDEEAMSETVRDKCWRFYTHTAHPRWEEHSNEFIMFHRYHQDDQGGRALATGEFDLWRYAAQADGDFYDEASDLKFKCLPLYRKRGEYLTPRRSENYYREQKKNEQVWASQFQGRPAVKGGKIFDVTLLQFIKETEVPTIIAKVRAWDNAATSGGGAYSAGVLAGIDATENMYLFDVVRDQVGTAERELLQSETAEKDGKLVQIHIPQDPGSAGVDIAFDFEQTFTRKGYVVAVDKAGGGEDAAGARVFTRSKVQRAYTASKSVNSRKVFIVLVQEHKARCRQLEPCNCPWVRPAWFKKFQSELQHFPASTYKDQVDAFSDAYSHLKRLYFRGRVIKTGNEFNLLHRSHFEARFGEKIPQHWQVEAAVRLAPDSSKPSGFAITARAAENAYIGEMVFVPAAERMYVDNPVDVLTSLRAALEKTCAGGEKQAKIIWLNKGGNAIFQVAAQKLSMFVKEFPDDFSAGLHETNWYFEKLPRRSPFYPDRIGTSRLQVMVDDVQYNEHDVRDEHGMLSLRQELDSWSFNEHGVPQAYGGIILDCLRMTLYKFALSATVLSDDERRFAKLEPQHQPDAVRALLGTDQYVEAVFAQEHALTMLRMKEQKSTEKARRDAVVNGDHVGARAVLRRFRRSAA